MRCATLMILIVSVGSWLGTGNLQAQQANPRALDLGPDVDEVVTLAQNWSDTESNWFYNVPQGSRLVPYRWFLNLEQPGSKEAFTKPEHFRSMGFLTRHPAPGNTDGLPVGLVRDALYEDGTEALGITCASCHTGLIRHGRKAFLIDGGPTMNDSETFLRRLAQSLQETADDTAKFERFAKKILGNDADADLKKDLRQALRRIAKERVGYNNRNLSREPAKRFGHGRIDAFGAIFNEVTTTFVGEDNVAPADAPVNFPCLWDAPQHDRVQWNGAAENRKNPLGLILFGTSEVGALGRNTGEVLGVFGNLEVAHELLIPRPYPNTSNKPNLLNIENSLKTLWSPKWPAELGAIDEAKLKRGKSLYSMHCQQCHHIIDRRDPQRSIKAEISNVGTDDQLLSNFARKAKTGKLQGRRKSLFHKERFKSEDDAKLILRHVVERAMLNTLQLDRLKELIASPPLDALAIGPGFDSTFNVTVGQETISVPLESFESVNGILELAGDKDVLDKVKAKLGGTSNARGNLELPQAVAVPGYKARPLNGVWATAPYLHNGSVPTLADLLKPADQRPKTFHVGSTEFDAVNVGYVSDPKYPLYDTTVPGNKNIGHQYGAELNDQQRADLLEFLKSL